MRVPIYPRGLDPAAERMKALEQMERMKAELQSSGAIQGAWTDIGPRPTVCTLCGSNVHWGAWTDSMGVDPTNSQTVYIGNPGAGVWKTTNGGTNWNPMTDNAPLMGIGSIAVAPSNPSVVYAGTGNWDFGVGILKSTDYGNSWTLLPGPFEGPFGPNQYFDGGFHIGALAVQPQNPNIVLAGAFEGQQSLRGIYRSTDGGNTWTQVFSGGRATSFAWNPQNGNIVYAAIGDYQPAQNGIYKSTDAGATWTLSENGVAATLFTTADDIHLSMCASNPSVIYASLPGISGGTLAVLKTVDGGMTWAQLPMPMASRAFQVIVHPQNPNIVFVGDVIMYRSLDGGQTWSAVSAGANGVYLFGDFRSLGFASDGSVLYVGDDGGVWKTFDAASSLINWTPLNDTQERTLFYPGSPISIHPTDPTIGFGGAQDLGILKYSGTKAWEHVQGCDGGTTLIDPLNPQNVYATCNGITIYKSTAGGAAGTWTSAITGIATGDRARFVPTIAIDVQNPQRLLYGTYRLYQSLNAAQTWSPISADLSNNCYAGIASISMSPVSSSTVYVGGQCNGTVYISTNAMAASPTWTDRSAGLPNNRDLTRVVADLTDPMTAYVTISGFTWSTSPQGHVFRTQNGGVTWTDISGNLPNIPVNDLAIDPSLPGTLYVATDIGVFSTSNGGTTWAPLGTGLPNAYVESLSIHKPSRTLRAATLGRGMWDFLLPSVPPPPAGPYPGNGATGVFLTQCVTWNSANGATSYDVYFGKSSPPPFVTNTGGTSYCPGTLTSGAVYYWQVVAKNAAGNTGSAIFSFTTNTTATGQLGFFALTPCRAVDTRSGQGKSGAFGPPALVAYSSRDFPLWSSGCGIPVSAQAYSLNMTAAPPGPLDFLSSWPTGQPYPNVSTLNSPDGSIIANAAIVPSGTGGSITGVTGKPSDLIIDVNGYFGAPNGSELVFYPITPCRVADTRPGQGKSGAFGPPGLAGYSSRDFPLLSGSCNIPATAKAYSLNMTAAPQGPLDFLSTWSAGQPYPNVSTLNSPKGNLIANAAIVPAGTNGAITVVGGNPTDLIIDINGYFAPPGNPGALHFYPVTPCRVADTRVGQGKTGAFGPPGLVGYSSRDFPILSSSCGIPPTAQAYSLNMTAAPQGPLDFLSTWPAGQPYPNVSTLNSPKGNLIANAAIVPAGTNGAITVVAGNPTDLIIDINGYFAP